MRASILKIGQVLDGRFRLVEEIGHGGMSTIFKAEDQANGCEPVVVKAPLPIFSSGIGGWSLFQQEEEIGRRLDHPFVLRFIPLAIDRRRSYLVTEYVPGQTLADHLRDKGILPEPEALAIGRQLCTALEYLHRSGVVHYDLKPGNVILCPDGTIRLIDFGLAHAVEDSRFSLGAAPPAIGSSGYIAPEQIRRKRGRRSVDIYALGAVLYEMLTGRPPFGDDDPFGVASARLIGDPEAPRRLNPNVSPETEEIVLLALRRDPTERYRSVGELMTALEHPERVIVSGLSERLVPPTPARRGWNRARHVAIVAVLPVVIQVLLFFAIWRHLASKR